MKQYMKVGDEYGIPGELGCERPLFLPDQEERAEKILKAVEGLRICTARALLKRCIDALDQSVVDVD